MKCGLTADCTDLQIGDHTPTRQQGDAQEPAVPDPPGLRRQHHRHDRQLRPLAADGDRPRGRDADAASRTPARKGEIVDVQGRRWTAWSCRWRSSRRTARAKKVNLKAARIIVAGGAGVGSKDNFKLIWDLANCLGAAVGGSAGGGGPGLHRPRPPGRPDRHDGPPGAVHRLRHQRGGPAPGGHGRSRPRSSRSTPTPTPRSSRSPTTASSAT